MYDILEYPSPSQTHNHQTRKRRPDRSVETSAERPPKRARLTTKNLKAFEKLGGRTRNGPKSKSSRSEPNLSRSGALSKSSATTGSTSKTVPTTARVLHLRMVSLIQPTPPPGNLNYLQDRLDRERNTASPTESEYLPIGYRELPMR
jgi:hypothetical protein